MQPYLESKMLSLYDEFHLREPVAIEGGAVCSHIVIGFSEKDPQAPFKDVQLLCQSLELEPPEPDARQYYGRTGVFKFKWERHTEFATFTFYFDNTICRDFSNTAYDVTPEAWRRTVKGRWLVATHILIAATELNDDPDFDPQRLFLTNKVAGARVCSGRAEIWSDFASGPDGFSRIAVARQQVDAMRLGRLVQRLIDVETYRIVALLGLDEAHSTNAEVDAIEAALQKLLEHEEFHSDDDPDRELLQQLLGLASRTEHLLSRTSFRFGATKAYARLVNRRLEELNEQRVEGAQRFGNFIHRRFLPAIDTCEAAQRRLHDLAAHVHRDAALIRTRIEISRQEQNNQLLEAMNSRAQMQFKLQETVEAISGIAISYYAISIVGYLAKSAKEIWPVVNPAVVTGIAAPLIISLVILLLWRLRKKTKRSA